MNISKRHKILSIKNKDEINLVLNNGRKNKTHYGPVFVYNDSDELNKKMAVLVKKNIGSAVKRNYVKRIVRRFICKFPLVLEENNRIIFIYTNSKPVTYSELESEYRRVLL